MLTIAQSIIDGIIAHAREDHPNMACGLVIGEAGSDQPLRLQRMINADHSPTFWRFEPVQQLRVWQEMDERGEEPLVIYRSYTAAEAYPSGIDIRLAWPEPSVHHVIVSTRHPDSIELRSFRITEQMVVEESIEVDPDID